MSIHFPFELSKTSKQVFMSKAISFSMITGASFLNQRQEVAGGPPTTSHLSFKEPPASFRTVRSYFVILNLENGPVKINNQ